MPSFGRKLALLTPSTISSGISGRRRESTSAIRANTCMPFRGSGLTKVTQEAGAGSREQGQIPLSLRERAGVRAVLPTPHFHPLRINCQRQHFAFQAELLAVMPPGEFGGHDDAVRHAEGRGSL